MNSEKTLAEFESLCLTGELGAITPDDVSRAYSRVFQLGAAFQKRFEAKADAWKPRKNPQRFRRPAPKSGMEHSLPSQDRE